MHLRRVLEGREGWVLVLDELERRMAPHTHTGLRAMLYALGGDMKLVYERFVMPPQALLELSTLAEVPAGLRNEALWTVVAEAGKLLEVQGGVQALQDARRQLMRMVRGGESVCSWPVYLGINKGAKVGAERWIMEAGTSLIHAELIQLCTCNAPHATHLNKAQNHAVANAMKGLLEAAHIPIDKGVGALSDDQKHTMQGAVLLFGRAFREVLSWDIVLDGALMTMSHASAGAMS